MEEEHTLQTNISENQYRPLDNDQAQSPTSAKFPSLELAYQLAVSSYDMAERRHNAIDNRFQSLITFGVTISLAVITIVADRQVSFISGWFIAALFAFFIAIVVAAIAQHKGKIRVIDPTILYQKWLELPPERFQKNLIFFSGEHFGLNCDIIDKKHRGLNVAAIVFLIEFILLAVWLA